MRLERVKRVPYIEKTERLTQKRELLILDDGRYFPLYSGELRRYGIEEGAYIEEEVCGQIMSEIVLKRCRERAMYILQRSDKTEKQLRDKLSEGKYPPEVIDSAILFAKKYGYVNDYEYAENYIRLHIDNQSIRMIKQKLRTKGIEREVYEELLHEYEERSGYSQENLIMDIIERKRFDCTTDEPREKNRIVSYLLRKGFEYSDISRCISIIRKKESIVSA